MKISEIFIDLWRNLVTVLISDTFIELSLKEVFIKKNRERERKRISSSIFQLSLPSLWSDG